MRAAIDRMDGGLLAILNRRMAVAARIARLKRRMGMAAYSPDREDTLLRRLASRNRGPLPAESLRAVFREVMSAARAMEEPVKVAYFGSEGTFTHLAALARFGSRTPLVSCQSIPDVFRVVEKRGADYGVVPVENSTEGVVNHTYDMLMESGLLICAEELIPIHHCFMTRARSIGEVRRVYSHQQVLAQCRRWLEDNMRTAGKVEVSSSAAAAAMAAKNRTFAAIGTPLAARINGLRVLARNIEDYPGNFTRFFVVGRGQNPRTGRDKTSVMFSVKDRVGALYDMLQPFRRHGINLTAIESRPSRKKPWEYYFFVDCAGHASEKRIASALRELERQCAFLKLLGTYPAAEPLAR